MNESTVKQRHISATRAVLSLHCKSEDACAECGTHCPCRTVKAVMDSMAGGVIGWFK